MTRVHFIEEVLCFDRTACNTRAKLTPENTTPWDEYVTCPNCLRALGYEVPTAEVLSLEPKELPDGRFRVAA